MKPPPGDHLAQAVELAVRNAKSGGAPFGALLMAPDGATIAAVNETHLTGDPTAHAEMQAIRAAGRGGHGRTLRGFVMYASGQPCPMCLAAMHLAGIARIEYAYSNEDAEPFGLSTARITEQLALPLAEQSIPIDYRPVRLDASDPYEIWQRHRAAQDAGGDAAGSADQG